MESIIELQHCHPTTSALDAVIPKYVERAETASFAPELSARENHFHIDMNICNHIGTHNDVVSRIQADVSRIFIFRYQRTLCV